MTFLDNVWLNKHLKQIKQKARSRYTPELNVDLPISKIFDGLSRSNLFYIEIRKNLGKVGREFRRISSKYRNKEIQKLYNKYSKNINLLLKLLGHIKTYDTDLIPWSKIAAVSVIANELGWRLSQKLREEKEKPESKKPLDPQNTNGYPRTNSDRFDTDIHYLYEANKALRHFIEFSVSSAAKLSNSPFLLLTGLAGSGKTHLLCDVVKHRISQDSSASILIFGEFFDNSRDFWKNIANQIGLDEKYHKHKILKALELKGKAKKSRSILIVDALNESKPLLYWKKNLVKLFKDVKKYPNIGLAVSVRTGFEEEVLPSNAQKIFIKEEHRGFQFREWEAVTKFFKEFSLPLPEIPLLTPEFQIPLFLLLFCKAFQIKNGKAPAKPFKGHEGANYIFEKYVDSVSKDIEDKFRIDHGPHKNIWDTIIEPVAEGMVKDSTDRLSEDKLVKLIKKAHPKIKVTKLLTEIEKNFLLVKVPSYLPHTNQYTGFDYRFPFQKFSDHLIGRYLFKQYEAEFGKPNKNIVTAKKFFSKRRKLGKFLDQGLNRGIIEALYIQCPEQLKGIEFFEVAPYISDYLAIEAFTESLIWRNPIAFASDLKVVLNFINKKVAIRNDGHNNLINAFLSITSVPNHPFNALFLHKHLNNIDMAKRDSWWSTFLHYYHNEKGSVDRLIEWGWSGENKDHISDESVQLCASTLVWFLTTPNRFVRDKATKALVELLTSRSDILLMLLNQFRKVNDPYVLERLYAVGYGCVLRNTEDDDGIKKLATWFYNNNFKNQIPPLNILTRDYAKGVIEVAIAKKLVKIDRSKIIPPYGSKFPTSIPSEKTLRKKYYPEDFFSDKTKDRGFLDIWSSVMYSFGTLGDFGNYEVNSALGHWFAKKLGDKTPSKKKQLKTFKEQLSKEQRKLFENLHYFPKVDFSSVFKSIDVSDKSSEEEIKKEQLEQEKLREKQTKEFLSSLSKKLRHFYKKEIEPFTDEYLRVNDPLDNFDTKLAQRWIFNRVVKLGWNSKLHGNFDSMVNQGRMDRSNHKPERIGKKYQWIAFHEFLALVADNFCFKQESWSDKPAAYEGVWQISERDIDPSCTLKEYPNIKPEHLPTFNKFKVKYDAWENRSNNLTWLKQTKGLPKPTQVIEIIDDKGVSWVILEGSEEWQKATPPEQEKYDYPTRTLWYLIKSYLVKRKDKRVMFEWAANQNFMGRWMPESHSFYNIFLGEYPDSLAFLYQYIPYYHHDGWTTSGRQHPIPHKVLVTDDEYLSSGSSLDCSTDEVINVKLPAKWIVNKMKLKQTYIDGRFFDNKNKLVAFDPKVFDLNMPRGLMFRKDYLLKFLEDNNLDIFWTILGEKNMIGGGEIGQPLGWMEINGVYKFDSNSNLIGKIKSQFRKPK